MSAVVVGFSTPLAMGTTVNQTVGSGQQVRYMFPVTGGTQYTITVTPTSPTSGDPDLYLGFSTVDFHAPADQGVLPPADLAATRSAADVLTYTARSDGVNYLAVYGFAASSFALKVAPSAPSDCQVDFECASGHCVELTPGGYKVCQDPPMQTTCGAATDQCCPATGMFCAGSAPCYAAPLTPSCQPAPPSHNLCGIDLCQADVDCAPNQICVPAGALGYKVRACANAHCKTPAQCTAHPGGACEPVADPCCGANAGLFCVYPNGGGCRSDADCPSSTHCAPDSVTGVASCKTGGPTCSF